MNITQVEFHIRTRNEEETKIVVEILNDVYGLNAYHVSLEEYLMHIFGNRIIKN